MDQSSTRVIAAFFLTPILVSFFMSFFPLFFEEPRLIPIQDETIFSIFFCMACYVSYGFACVLGIPTYFLLKRYHKLKLGYYFLSGIVFSIIFLLLCILLADVSTPPPEAIMWVVSMMSIGTFIFWAIAHWSPDDPMKKGNVQP